MFIFFKISFPYQVKRTQNNKYNVATIIYFLCCTSIFWSMLSLGQLILYKSTKASFICQAYESGRPYLH